MSAKLQPTRHLVVMLVSLPLKRAALAMNRVQFQPGLSLPAFLQRYNLEACKALLLRARWPQGFVYPTCFATHATTFERRSRTH